MNKKKLLYNTITSVILQIITIVCGFIIPRLLLKSFGSETNGLVNSISNFLGFITVLEMGFGSVIHLATLSSLCKEATHAQEKINKSAAGFITSNLVINHLDFVQILQEELTSTKVLLSDYDCKPHKELCPMQPDNVPITFSDRKTLLTD